MLQSSDKQLIAMVVAPLSFELINGQVVVEIPPGLVSQTRAESGRVTTSPYKFPLSQKEIETRVLELARKQRIAKMAVNFNDHMTILSFVLIQAAGRRGSHQLIATKSVDLDEQWQNWQSDVEAQFDKALSPQAVAIPHFPPLPDWYQDKDKLKGLADKLGQTKNLFKSNQK